MTDRRDISDDDVAALVGLMADAASAFIRGTCGRTRRS